jgi:phage tail-like protein
MDANGSRYHALVTWPDWEALLPGPPGERELAWSDSGAGDAPLATDCGAGGLALKGLLYEFRSRATTAPQAGAAHDVPAAPDIDAAAGGGRGGVFDAWDNLYSLSPDRTAIRIRSVGSGAMSDFWPVTGARAGAPPRDGIAAIAGLAAGRRAPPPGGAGSFAPPRADDAPAPLRLDALTVTRGHYLVVATAAARGLLVFDLHGAGPPLFQSWPGLGRRPGQGPPAPAPAAEALIALEDGGIGALVDSWLWCLGPDLKPQVPAAAAAHAFQPAPALPGAGATAHGAGAGAAIPPGRLDLRPALGATTPAELLATEVGAVAALRGARLLVLGRRTIDGRAVPLAGVVRLDGSIIAVLDGRSSAPRAAGALDDLVADVAAPAPESGPRPRPELAARALALDYGADRAGVDAGFSFVVLAAGGDQALRFAASWRDAGLAIEITRDYLPLRRYLGFGLAALPGGLRLQAYPAARVFYATGERWAPLLALPQPRYLRRASVVTPAWDSGIPACVWHRIALDLRLPLGTGIGIETRAADDQADLERLPWRAAPGPARSPAGSELPWRATTSATDAASGTWGTLLQEAHGRWLQVRITLSGDGRQTPLLRGLRAWFPRFSYAAAYLPPVYRTAPADADFLDRFLALFEGEFTRWEERIAAAQQLFDARTAPAATLDWLASWVGLTLDPGTDEARRRLLIRHAMTSHARRGTVPGLLLGATLAWETTVDPGWLSAPEALATRPHGLRLQEMFGLVAALPARAWNPAAQSRAELIALLDGDAALADPEPGAADPGGASRRAVLLRALGFVPRAASEEAQLWSAWCAARGDDGAVLPADEAPTDAGRAAWTGYLDASRPCAPLRQRWQDFLARRWRRISALNAAWGTAWRGFERVPAPVAVPAADATLADWHRFEARVLRALAGAHRFRIVLPLPEAAGGTALDLDDLARRRAAVLRVVAAAKPAHTVAEVRFGFDLFRIGEARLGLDSRLEAGLARRPELAALGLGSGRLAPAVLGRTDLGGAGLAPIRPLPPADRIGLDRG